MEPAEIFNSWKSAWLSAKTESSQFEVLSRISQMLLSQSKVPADQLEDIFETVGASPFCRLLSAPPEAYSSFFTRKKTLTILTHFCSVPQIVCKENMCSFVKPLQMILNETLPSLDNETIIFQALHCLFLMLSNEKCCNQMLIDGLFPVLCELYCYNSCGEQQSFVILTHLVMFGEVEATVQNQEAFDSLIANMSQQFVSENSIKKFSLCSQILTMVLRCAEFTLQVESAIKIRKSLTLILQHALPKEHRDNAIKLASLLVDKLGESIFILEPDDAKMFFSVLVQLSCVEIRMLLEDKSVSDVIGKSFLLTASYTIFEYAISTIITDGWFESNRNYGEKFLDSIKAAMEVALDFLKRAESDLTITFNVRDMNPRMQIVLATLRVVCSWLAEETFALQEKVHEVLPFILRICKEWFQQTQRNKLQWDIDPLRFLMSPLCHLTADNKSREILLNNGLLSLLLQYFQSNWKQFKTTFDSQLNRTLTTMCGIFLNVVVLEPHLATSSNELFLLWKTILVESTSVSTDSEYLILRAYFFVLGLLITKHCYKKVKNRETSFYPFLSASIKFLWDAHYVEAQDVTLCLTRKYKNVWEDIMELWFLGMQALCSLLPIMPWIANFIAESGWLDVIIHSLSKVSATGIDGNIKSTYQALLCALVQSSNDIAEVLIQKTGISVCQKHNLVELEKLLADYTTREKNLS